MAADLSKAALLYRSAEERNFSLPDRPEVRLGFDRSNEVSVPFEGVSRRHAAVSFDGKSYWIEDLGSSNGTFLNGRRLTKKQRLDHLDVVTLGRKTDLIFVRKQVKAPRVTRRGIRTAWLEALDGADRGVRRDVPRGSVTLGRSTSTNVVVDSNLVSKIHARVERNTVALSLIDLHSANGTFINGQRVESQVLADGDEFNLGGSRSYRVHIEEGEIEAGDISAAPISTFSGPLLPTDWKTRYEWTPEEAAAFEEARRGGGGLAPGETAKKLPAVPNPVAHRPMPAPAEASKGEQAREIRPEPAARPPAPKPTPAPAPPPTAAAAPDRAPGRVVLEGKAQKFSLGIGDHEVGRVSSAQIYVVSPTISRRHAVIRVRETGAVLEDLGSQNGTLVNTARLKGPYTLREGDIVHFGDVGFRVRFEAPAPKS